MQKLNLDAPTTPKTATTQTTEPFYKKYSFARQFDEDTPNSEYKLELDRLVQSSGPTTASKSSLHGNNKQSHTVSGEEQRRDNKYAADAFSNSKIPSDKRFNVYIANEAIGTFVFDKPERAEILFLNEDGLIDEIRRQGDNWLYSRVNKKFLNDEEPLDQQLGKLIDKTHLVSLFDSIWIARASDTEVTWDKVDPHNNDFSSSDIEAKLLMIDGADDRELQELSCNPNFVQYGDADTVCAWTKIDNKPVLVTRYSDDKLHDLRKRQSSYYALNELDIDTIESKTSTKYTQKGYTFMEEYELITPGTTVRSVRSIFGDDVSPEKLEKLCGDSAKDDLVNMTVADALLGYDRDEKDIMVVFDSTSGKVIHLMKYRLPIDFELTPLSSKNSNMMLKLYKMLAHEGKISADYVAKISSFNFDSVFNSEVTSTISDNANYLSTKITY